MLAKEFDGVCGNSVLEKSLKTQNTTSGAEGTQGTKTTRQKKNMVNFDLLHNLYCYIQIGSVALRADGSLFQFTQLVGCRARIQTQVCLILKLILITNVCGLKKKKKICVELETKTIYEKNFIEKFLTAMTKEVQARALEMFTAVCSLAGREKIFQEI